MPPQRVSSHRSRWRRTVHDPGLARLRVASAAAIALGVVIALESLYASIARPQSAALAMLLGGVAAMQVSGALMQPRWQNRLETAGWQALLVSATVALDILVRAVGGHGWELGLLLPLTFVAVWLRRFGAQFVTLGLMMWVGYYLGAFLTPTWPDLPFVVGAETLSALVAFGLSITVWGHRPRLALRHTIATWNRQVDAILADADRLANGRLSPASLRRRRRKLEERGAQLTTTALTLEGWLADGGDAHGWHPTLIRHQLIEEHLAVETITAAAFAASSDPSNSEPSDAMVQATRQLAELRSAWQQPPRATRRGVFTPVTGIVAGGALPGPARVTANIPPRGHGSARKLSLTTRQAIQVTVALAIALPLGYLVSPVHYAWALVAVFIVFLGTSTRGDVLVKATHRVLGTVAGLILAVPLSWLIDGRPLGVIALAVVACFIGHYLMNVGYIYLMLCVTVVIPQMYDRMGELNGRLLELRITETLIGSVIAVAVAMLVVPISTHDTAQFVRRNLLTSVAGFLEEAANRVESGSPVDVDDLHRLAREIDDHARLLAVAAKPLAWRWGRRPALRAQLALYRRCARDAHRLARRVTTTDDKDSSPELTTLLRALAADVRLLIEPVVSPRSRRHAIDGGRNLDPQHPLADMQRTLGALHVSS